MKRIILHIGAVQTGSGVLQRQLTQNRELLFRQGLLYPYSPFEDKGILGNGIILAKELKKENFEDRKIAHIVNRAISEANGKDILFSSELLENYDTEALRFMRKVAKSKGYEIVILYYVRAIIDHIVYLYHHAVKNKGLTKKFDEIAPIYLNKQGHYRFVDVIYKSIKILGKESVTVRNYDRVYNKLFQDFLNKVAGIRINSEKFKIDNYEPNQPLKEMELRMLLKMNEQFDDPSYSKYIADMFISSRDGKNRFQMSISKEFSDKLGAKYWKDTEFINSLLPEFDKPLNVIENTNIATEDNKKKPKFNPFQSTVVSLVGGMAKDISDLKAQIEAFNEKMARGE